MKNCAIYTRVSTDLQAEKEYNSCQSQEDKVRAYVSSQNQWNIFNVYADEGFTGANINRPAFQRLLSDLDKIDLILFYKLDRLTRSPKDFYHLVELFEKNEVDFVSITEHYDTSTPSGRLLMNIMLTFAQFERELTSERVKDKMTQRASKGIWNGGSVPFGYVKKNKALVIDPPAAKIVQEIYNGFVNTKSRNRVYAFLKDKYSDQIQKCRLDYILRNPVYTGKTRYAGVIQEGVHKPIISSELFEKAQALHGHLHRRAIVRKVQELSGLIRCAHCGTAMTPVFTNKQTKKRLKRYYYYRCLTANKVNWAACPVKNVSSDKLFQFIKDEFQHRLLNFSTFGDHSGLEPDVTTSGFSPEQAAFTIQEFLKAANEPNQKERQKRVREFIKEIQYAPEEIRIAILPKGKSENIIDDKLIHFKNADINSENSESLQSGEELAVGAGLANLKSRVQEGKYNGSTEKVWSG